MNQQPGQDKRAFLESLNAAASEADVGGMTLQDALCMRLVSGIHYVHLKEKLSELGEPTLPASSTIIDAHLHAKAFSGSTAVMDKVFMTGNRNRGQNKQGGQGQQRPTGQSISDAEKKHPTVKKGKCYR